jgi:hypothetical protein
MGPFEAARWGLSRTLYAAALVTMYAAALVDVRGEGPGRRIIGRRSGTLSQVVDGSRVSMGPLAWPVGYGQWGMGVWHGRRAWASGMGVGHGQPAREPGSQPAKPARIGLDPPPCGDAVLVLTGRYDAMLVLTGRDDAVPFGPRLDHTVLVPAGP